MTRLPLPPELRAAASAFWRSPYPLIPVAAFAAVQVTAALNPEAGVPAALRAGLVTAAGALLVLLAGTVLYRLIVPATDSSPLAAWRPSAGQIAIAGGLLLAATLLRAPQRLTANLIGYTLVAIPLLWVTRRHAGERAAQLAAAALALLAFFPTHLKDVVTPTLPRAEAGSPFRWPVGWPDETWTLRHQIRLPQPHNGPVLLRLELAAPYSGPVQVLGRVNGRDAGAFRPIEGDLLQLEIPAALVAGTNELTFELRLTRLDPALRLVGHRWSGGASLGASASTYFDGASWHPGTYDTGAGRPAAGSYALELILR